MYLLGYDIGSSSIKAALVDADTKQVLNVVSYPEREMPIISVKEGWAEQSPEDWWENIKSATKLLLSTLSVDKEKIQAIGIAYQMHGLVALDKSGVPVRSSIIWCDSRAVSIGETAFNEIGRKECLETILNSPGNFTASKLGWVKEFEPNLYEKIDKVMLPGDYIAYKLTGEALTTNTGLSEGMFWDFKEEKPSETILNHFGFSKDLIPEVKPVFSNQGKIKPSIAAELGISKEAIVTYRAGDQPNNALAMNVLEPGEIAATAGTSGVVYGVVDEMKYDPENRVNSFAHVNHSSEERRIGVLLCINGTGSAYSWLRNNTSVDTSYFELEELASSVDIGSEGLSFMPFGNGAERMLGNRSIGASYRNIQFNRHTKAHMTRACLEGIAFSFAYGIDCMKDTGLSPELIRAGNDNMFQSAIFSKTIASLTGTVIKLKSTTGAVGAALGAGYGIRHYTSLREALETKEDQQQTIYPDKNKDQYIAAYDKWASEL